MPAPPNRARVISPKMEPGTDFQVLPPPVASELASDPEGGGALRTTSAGRARLRCSWNELKRQHLPVLDFRGGSTPSLRGVDRLPEEIYNSLAGPRMAVWIILNGTWKSKMEIPVKEHS